MEMCGKMYSKCVNLQNLVWGLLLAVLVVSEEGLARSLPCEFPLSWRGHWHQASLGQVYVTADAISKKGVCVEHYSDYYLMRNTERNCISCLLMLMRHDNIIQYKESFCSRASNLRSTCNNIQVEAIMYTLVKEPTEPLPCPFPDNYRVSYDEQYGAHGAPCPEAQSSLRACATTEGASSHAMAFTFQHCSSQALWNGHDLVFECLATWKEGSADFLYGRFSGDVIARKDDSYRCFKYDARGVVIQLAMSADATCRGLVTPEVGPIVMRLEKDLTHEPKAGCIYPVWLTSSRWQDVTRDISVAFHGHRHKMALEHSDSGVHERLICQDIIQLDADEYVVSAFVPKNCGVSYQCLSFKRLNERAFRLRRSAILDTTPDAYDCNLRTREPMQTQVFLSLHALAEPLGCPMPGLYSFAQAACHLRMRVGCSALTNIELASPCPAVTSASLHCITYWQETGQTIWIVEDKLASKLYCMGVSEESRHNFRLHSCNQSDAPASLDQVVVTRHGTCQDNFTAFTTSPRPQVEQPRLSTTSRTENTFRHNHTYNSNPSQPGHIPIAVPTAKTVYESGDARESMTSSKHEHSVQGKESDSASHPLSSTGALGQNCHSCRFIWSNLAILLYFQKVVT